MRVGRRRHRGFQEMSGGGGWGTGALLSVGLFGIARKTGDSLRDLPASGAFAPPRSYSPARVTLPQNRAEILIFRLVQFLFTGGERRRRRKLC